MSQAPARPRARRRARSSDGGHQHHLLLNAAAGYTVLAGIVSLVIGLLNVAATVGAILGLTGFVLGMFAQLMSVTRAERMVIVVGVTASFVGMGLGIAHGGF